MKNTIATIILGIAVLFIGIALAFHIWTTEQKTEQSTEVHSIEASVDSTLWSDFSHPDTLYYNKFIDARLYRADEAIIYTYHPNGIMAMGDYNSTECDDSKCAKTYFVKRRGFWNENGKFIAAYIFKEKHWRCLKSNIPTTFTQALYGAYRYDVNEFMITDAGRLGLPTKNPASCPER